MGTAWISVYELQQHTFLVVSEILVCYCGIVHEVTVGILATEEVLCTILHIATSQRLQVQLAVFTCSEQANPLHSRLTTQAINQWHCLSLGVKRANQYNFYRFQNSWMTDCTSC